MPQEPDCFIENHGVIILNVLQSTHRTASKKQAHTESWYGYFTTAEYARYVKDKEYAKKLLKILMLFIILIQVDFSEN